MNKSIRCAAILFLVTFTLPLYAAKPVLKASTETSQTGHFQLSWEHEHAEAVFILQQDSSPAFDQPVIIYEGPDRARTISGMLNGEYYFRVGTGENQWSDPVLVKVEHYELSTAFTFLGLGAVVFLATAVLIIRGHIMHHRAE